VLLLGAHGLIATADQFILREQNAETHIEKSLGIVSRHAKAESPSLESAVSLVSAASYNFYHWVIDSLPKVTLAEACGFKGSYVVPALGVNPIVQESLILLGIDASRIVPMEYPVLTVYDLWFPTHFHGHLMEDTPELHAEFRQQMLAGASKISVPTRRKLYVKRSAARRIRFIVNADEVETLLASFGFDAFEMERMTLREQVALMAQASCLLGPHGAGILHSLWMPRQSTVIEILPSCFQSEVMSVHSRLLGHQYFPFVVSATGPSMGMEVDCEALARALASASR
jgi:capsular polysaccharide biosynthesis protein